MYVQIETTSEITMDNGNIIHPIATLRDEYDSVCQIINDDHCYVVCLKQPDGKYTPTTHIFREVFEVLKELQHPN